LAQAEVAVVAGLDDDDVAERLGIVARADDIYDDGGLAA